MLHFVKATTVTKCSWNNYKTSSKFFNYNWCIFKSLYDIVSSYRLSKYTLINTVNVPVVILSVLFFFQSGRNDHRDLFQQKSVAFDMNDEFADILMDDDKNDTFVSFGIMLTIPE